jgi:hypothetical protein
MSEAGREPRPARPGVEFASALQKDGDSGSSSRSCKCTAARARFNVFQPTTPFVKGDGTAAPGEVRITPLAVGLVGAVHQRLHSAMIVAGMPKGTNRWTPLGLLRR